MEQLEGNDLLQLLNFYKQKASDLELELLKCQVYNNKLIKQLESNNLEQDTLL